jgi:hypothetical protein
MSKFRRTVKALKAANTIEAAPQRVERKQAAAEEPITARIRRRTEAIPASDPASQPDAPSPTGTPADRAQDSSTKPQMTFQERLAVERQRNDQEPGLP